MSNLNFVTVYTPGSTTLGLAILQEATGEFFDFSIDAFVAGTPTTLTSLLSESTLIAGFFRISLNTTGFANAFPTGAYDFILYDSSIPSAVGVVTEKHLVGADNTGADSVILAANGVDAVMIETNVNMRQALSPILSASAGVVAGAGTGTVSLKAGGNGNSGTARITASTDVNGNRTAVNLNLPS